jgi:hypothetical protein
LSLPKVTLMFKQSVKLRRYILCGDVEAHVHTARLKCKLPDDGRVPKHIEEF